MSLRKIIQQHDTIDIIAPGFAPTREQIQSSLDYCRQLGFKPRLAKNLLGRDLLCANTDQLRFRGLKAAFEASDSRIIWSLRGGYGAVRLLPMLDIWLPKVKHNLNKKVFIGLSDNTTLHLYINSRLGWPSIHGPHLNTFNPKKWASAENEMASLIQGQVNSLTFSKLKALNQPAKKQVRLRGKITGGNLAVFLSHLGTPVFPRLKNKILFFEDLGERAYKIDRMLVQLQRARVFDEVQAVLFGPFERCAEPDGRELWPKIIRRFANEIAVPVLTGLPSGHNWPSRSVFFGLPSELWLSRGVGTLVQDV